MMLDHTFLHEIIRFHNNTIQFIHFHFIMRNINIKNMLLNMIQHYIHNFMVHILKLCYLYLYIILHKCIQFKLVIK